MDTIIHLGAILFCLLLGSCDRQKEPTEVQFIEFPAKRSDGTMDFAAYLNTVIIRGDPVGKLSSNDRLNIRQFFAAIGSRLETLDKKDQFISTDLPIWKLLDANFPTLKDSKDTFSNGKVSLIKLGNALWRLKE